jgi:hypothetical protein
VRRMDKGDIYVPSFDPDVVTASGIVGFQREFVWSKSQADRFIESLLLGLPVPGIFLVQEPDSTLLVLDGQQRLRSLQAYYSGVLRGKEFKLQYVQEPFKGLGYKHLAAEDRRRLDDSILHATIVRQDEPTEDQSSIYAIFERLNTGGTLLQPQEIRVALYHGGLVRLLRELNDNEDWRALYGKRSNRLKDQELILRFLAFYRDWESYKSPMKDFLNQFMARHRNPDAAALDEFRTVFKETAHTILNCIGPKAFRLATAANAAVIDSLMVGVAQRRSAGGQLRDGEGLRTAYQRLLEDSAYRAAVERSTADEDSVAVRFSKVRDALATVA